jgi:hypothetical protein
MAWQTAPGMIIIVGGFSLVGALFSGVDGLSNWIYKKVSQLLKVRQVRQGGQSRPGAKRTAACVSLSLIRGLEVGRVWHCGGWGLVTAAMTARRLLGGDAHDLHLHPHARSGLRLVSSIFIHPPRPRIHPHTTHTHTHTHTHSACTHSPGTSCKMTSTS